MNLGLLGFAAWAAVTVAALRRWLRGAGPEYGACLLYTSPTEILAEQHFATLSGFLAPFGLRVAKLTGSMRAAEKRAVLAGLASVSYTHLPPPQCSISSR